MQADTQRYDAIIIGAGPAGVSCAVWLARLGFLPLVVEASSRIGGLCLGHPYHDNWNATLPGRTGPEVAEQLAASLEQAQVPLQLNNAVVRVEASGQTYVVTLLRGERLLSSNIVLATGVRARGLSGLSPGSQPMPGVLIGPGEHVAAQNFQGKRVAVLGGGDNAFENALFAQDRGAEKVDVYARNVRAQQQFVRAFPGENVYPQPDQLDLGARTVQGKRYDLILVCYGWEPCVSFADGLPLARTEQGFIATEWATAQTSLPGVYAVGEVAKRQHPCVVTALADGVTAAKAIQARLEAGL
ncbi:NAD(P)/FAD-dependent oxidoreductase [Pusillimonas sp. CC-YST705]|uniref:NAD(P)/FAD-dependent oxidoreductase n=1 Tax=Mesopusillimonas faecipullorum TaxID=2755040 RepID=A0ABS8CCG9_9BURK|nr:NAD(P)/FAD-dependent oxidoreductase [Mesopusillimonas faecipullorum]MCB5363735.1 NAD(P)/FAD-dependent oxidoreductase [Mesopusillimonas faecipullorum]